MNAFNRDIEPNKTAVLQQLTALFPPEFVHPYPDALVEIAYGMPGNLDKAELFSAFKLDAAANFAVAKNRRGCNVYVGPTLKKGDTAPFARTNDDDFLAGLWAWTDHDAEGDFDRAKGKAKELGLAPGMIVDTGTVPHLRAHAYFKMSGAVTDAEQLRAVNKSLQSSLGGDPVQAPSHVMRLAGTINYPTPKKAARGYVVEPVKVRVHRTPPPNRAETILGLSPNGAGASDSRRKGSLGFVLPRSDGELLELLAESRKPSKWHFSMRDAIATMIGRGWSDLQIRGMCAPYCLGGIADPDLAPLIDGGRKKFDKPNEEKEPAEPETGPPKKRFVFETTADLRSGEAEEHLIEGYVPEQSTGLFWGKWGSFKTFVVFDWALHLAYGFKSWHGAKLPGKPCHVLIIAREGKKGFVKRIDAFKKHHNLTEDPEHLTLMRSALSFLDNADFAELKKGIKDLGRPFRLVLVDTVGRVLPGEDMAKEQPITLFMERLQQVGELTGAASIGVHHENKSGDANGSMYFQNNSDFMFSVTRDGDKLAGKLTCVKQKDGEDHWSKDIMLIKIELEDGKSSLVVESVSEDKPERDKSEKKMRPPSAGTQRVWDCVNEAIINGSIDHRVGGSGPAVRACDLNSAREEHRRRYVYQGDGDDREKAGAERQAWRYGYEALLKARKIGEAPAGERNLVWVVAQGEASK